MSKECHETLFAGTSDVKLMFSEISVVKVSSSYYLCVEFFSQLSFDSEMYTKSAVVADFVYVMANVKSGLE